MKIRVGFGFDVHRLVSGRELWLGGIKLDYELGLLGHSDADVLTHAVMDALLGACGLQDIGTHFPDTDAAYKGADSLKLLSEVGRMLREAGYRVENIDATILCQRPKLRPFISAMQSNLARVLELEPGQVNIKATTEEGLGFTGEGLGIAAHAVCLLEKADLR